MVKPKITMNLTTRFEYKVLEKKELITLIYIEKINYKAH